MTQSDLLLFGSGISCSCSVITGLMGFLSCHLLLEQQSQQNPLSRLGEQSLHPQLQILLQILSSHGQIVRKRALRAHKDCNTTVLIIKLSKHIETWRLFLQKAQVISHQHAKVFKILLVVCSCRNVHPKQLYFTNNSTLQHVCGRITPGQLQFPIGVILISKLNLCNSWTAESF